MIVEYLMVIIAAIQRYWKMSTGPQSCQRVGFYDPLVMAEFDRLAQIPYEPHPDLNRDIDALNKLRALDCDEKSWLFINFLHEMGVEAKLITVVHKSSEYAHAFVKWDGAYFDIVSKPPQYAVTKDVFYNILEKNGYDISTYIVEMVGRGAKYYINQK